jgi:uncharacterized membrane protein YbhN (UPF0104 family)
VRSEESRGKASLAQGIHGRERGEDHSVHGDIDRDAAMLTPAGAHLACVGLVLLDFAVRTWRTQLFLRSLRTPLPFREVFVHSVLGEAASSLTPMRVGGEASRVWAMTRLGVAPSAAVVVVGVEWLATTPVIVAMAVVLGFTLAPDWWAEAGPALTRSILGRWRWWVAMGVVMALAWWLGRRLAPRAARRLRAELREARAHAREIPAWVYALSVPLTVVNVAARVAILPILAHSLVTPPSLAGSVVGSFTLLYAQALLPTPAGAGAVELTFLGGGAGDLGAGESRVLLLWRFYTTGIGVILGLVLTFLRYRTVMTPRAPREPAQSG